MEVAIPIIALGAMYVISNQKKHKENFETAYKKEQRLPNTEPPPINYPIQTNDELEENVNYYPNPNTATDKYYLQEAYENIVNKSESKQGGNYTSMTGNKVSAGIYFYKIEAKDFIKVRKMILLK